MRMHQVEVDGEVFSFVKAHAEPLVDDFNSVLRRLLPLQGQKRQEREVARRIVPSTKDASPLPSLPRGMPRALHQILEVTRLVRGGAYSRTSATQFVAKQHAICWQTVHDKYCRQLNLTANQFDRLLEQEGSSDLRTILTKKFPLYTKEIEEALG
jgi:hypothetical protein